VVGARGPGGGYTLARPVDSISIADIILAVDEPLDITECEGEKNCRDGRRCLAHDLWSELTDQLHEFLSGIHLGELMRRSGIEQAPDGTPLARVERLASHRVSLPE
jgi:Rrf2 family iron-sulfur cluster assembly transcriptional regulator